jgi:hypothetical protein
MHWFMWLWILSFAITLIFPFSVILLFWVHADHFLRIFSGKEKLIKGLLIDLFLLFFRCWDVWDFTAVYFSCAKYMAQSSVNEACEKVQQRGQGRRLKIEFMFSNFAWVNYWQCGKDCGYDAANQKPASFVVG